MIAYRFMGSRQYVSCIRNYIEKSTIQFVGRNGRKTIQYNIKQSMLNGWVCVGGRETAAMLNRILTSLPKIETSLWVTLLFLKNWMTDEGTWKCIQFVSWSLLLLQNWMTDEGTWKCIQQVSWSLLFLQNWIKDEGPDHAFRLWVDLCISAKLNHR